MAAERKLTPAQQRALRWLPKDGSWRDNEETIRRCLLSLFHGHEGIVEWEYPDGGHSDKPIRWRLTPKGVEMFGRREA